MRMASATASTRSTVSTTSAASDDAVAPRASEGHPDPGGREGGGVVDAVPDHDGARGGGLVADGRELVGGVAVGEHGVDTDDPAHRLGDVGTVAGEQDGPPDPDLAQGRDHPGRIRPDRVLEQERPGRCAVHGDEDREAPVERGPAAHLTQPRWIVTDDPPCLAEPDRRRADPALEAVAVHLVDGRREHEVDVAGPSSPDEGAREGVG